MENKTGNVSFNLCKAKGGKYFLTNNKKKVIIINDYWISETEVTYELWQEVYTWALNEGYSFANTSIDRKDKIYKPAAGLNWRDAIVWCNALSEKNGFTPVYTSKAGYVIKNSNSSICDDAVFNNSFNGYRLLSEVEWEIAARGADIAMAKKSFDDDYAGSEYCDDVAWWYSNSGGVSHNVGTKQPNELGIYDMSGNIEEWCWDWFDWEYPSSEEDPSGPSTGKYRVIHGGHFEVVHSGALECGTRGYQEPSQDGYGMGIRIGKND